MEHKMQIGMMQPSLVTSPNLDPSASDASDAANMLSRLRRGNRALDHLRYALELDEQAAASASVALIRDEAV